MLFRSRRADALYTSGLLTFQQSDFNRAVALLEEALALQKALGDTSGMASSLNTLGRVARQQGDVERATALHEAALAAVKTWRCTPARRDGQPVRAVAMQPFMFVLQ